MYQNSYQTGQIYPTERDEYANWETYPQNLHVSPLGVDAYRSSHQIDRLSKELFVANHESSFDFLAMDPPRDGKYLQHMLANSQLTCQQIAAAMQHGRLSNPLRNWMHSWSWDRPPRSCESICFTGAKEYV